MGAGGAMVADRISIESAKKEKLFYFVANVVVYRESDGRCLILKRDKREKVHPERYAVPGGKLEWKNLDINNPTRINGDVLDYENAIENLLRREVKEEAGIEIKPGLAYINSIVFIRPDNIPVVLVKFAARYKSGDVVLEKGGFTDHAWVNAEEVRNYSCIDGIPDEVAQAISAFSNSR
jgi:8-oxo-dGTP pyrophosphatase MutT (NUDIX family)